MKKEITIKMIENKIKELDKLIEKCLKDCEKESDEIFMQIHEKMIEARNKKQDLYEIKENIERYGKKYYF